MYTLSCSVSTELCLCPWQECFHLPKECHRQDASYSLRDTACPTTLIWPCGLVSTWDDSAEGMSVFLCPAWSQLSWSKKSSTALCLQRRSCAAQPWVPGSMTEVQPQFLVVTGRRQWSSHYNLVHGGEVDVWTVPGDLYALGQLSAHLCKLLIFL